MRLIVHGQQAYGKSVLEAILDKGVDEVVAVYCAPDKEGRPLDPLKEFALEKGLPVHQPESYKNPEVWEQLASHDADLCVMAYVLLFVPVVVAIKRFSADTDAEVARVAEAAEQYGVTAIDCTHWADGGAGTEDLAHHVVKMTDANNSQFAPLYDSDMPLWDKMRTIATRIYGAEDIIADKKVRDQIDQFQATGFGNLPICVAKTQYSFSTDPNLKGAPSGHVVPIREVRLSAGAGFLVFVCGEIMTMPGLPRVPAADKIHIDDEGLIQGLF